MVSLLLLASLTLAPRTSQPLENGWQAYVLGDTFGRTSTVSTFH